VNHPGSAAATFFNSLLGLVLAFGAHYGNRSVMRHEPCLAEINPTLPQIFFAAKMLGMMIVATGLISTAVTAYS
jgi:hypothetical protein